jgi:hypothetical protein
MKSVKKVSVCKKTLKLFDCESIREDASLPEEILRSGGEFPVGSENRKKDTLPNYMEIYGEMYCMVLFDTCVRNHPSHNFLVHVFGYFVRFHIYSGNLSSRNQKIIHHDQFLFPPKALLLC